MKIFINPGHMPGVDPGAVSESYGVTEADIVKSVGFMLAEKLRADAHEVYVLQSDNLAGESYGYPNVTATANEWGADIFISLHCNAAASAQAHGTETFCYGYEGEGYKLATCINDAVVEGMDMVDRGVKVNQSFIVLRRTAMPAVLVELGFMTNNADCYKLITNKADFAEAVAKGIENYTL